MGKYSFKEIFIPNMGKYGPDQLQIRTLFMQWKFDLIDLRITFDAETPKWNQVKFGVKRLKVFAAKIWINLPYHIKSPQSLKFFYGMGVCAHF